MASLTVAGSALAQETPTEASPPEFEFDGVAPEPSPARPYLLEIGFRGRMMSVPRSFLDIWYFNDDNANWAWIEPRPEIRGLSLGVEVVMRNENNNGIFYAEYLDANVPAGYWDDIEDPANHLDGDYLRPSDGLGLVALGGNYAYEAHIVRSSDTAGRFGMSYLVGGGLGISVVTGFIDRWRPDDEGNPSYKRFLDGEPPDDIQKVPRVFPMVDVSTGMRFSFGDRAVFRLEGGLHTLLYLGATAGVVF